jgi:hypothetical protein
MRTQLLTPRYFCPSRLGMRVYLAVWQKRPPAARDSHADTRSPNRDSHADTRSPNRDSHADPNSRADAHGPLCPCAKGDGPLRIRQDFPASSSAANQR